MQDEFQENQTPDMTDAEVSTDKSAGMKSILDIPSLTAQIESTTDEREILPPEKNHEQVISDMVRNNKPDLVAGRYRILLNQALVEYCNDFAQAYEVNDSGDRHDEQLYCLVFNKGVPIRFNVINILKSVANPNFITPLAAEITYISSLKESRFVVILNKPRGVSLSAYITSSGPKPEEFISQIIIPQLVPVLDLLDSLHIEHGRINPDNIFIELPMRNIVLGECVSSPSGYFQPILYETIDRAITMPIGKGEGNGSTDYYALGISALFVQLGKPPSVDADEDILQAKLQNGTFNTLLRNFELTPGLMDLYRGLLNDKAITRWGCSQLKDWLRGKYFNLVRTPPPVESTRSILFHDVQFFNLQALSYSLFKNWRIAKVFLREDKITKWVEGSVGNPDTAARIRHVQRITSTGKPSSFFDLDDELVARIIQLLSPAGPFQFKTLSINPNAFGAVIAYEFSRKKLDILQVLAIAFTHNLFGYLDSFSEKDEQSSKLLWHLRNTMEFIPRTSLGFGIERCLYELNPGLPCQSPLVASEFPLTLNEVLEILDEKCKKSDEYPMDRHIAAFIANRLNMNTEIRIKGLASHPKFSRNTHIQATALLAMAQKETKIKKLSGISNTMAKHLAAIADSLHGQTYKAELVNNINKVAREGIIASLYKVVSDPQFILTDQQGFEEARLQYAKLEAQLSKLKGKNTIANLGYHYGLRLAVVIAYLLCGLEFLYFIAR